MIKITRFIILLIIIIQIGCDNPVGDDSILPIPWNFHYEVEPNYYLKISWDYDNTKVDGFIITKTNQFGNQEEYTIDDTINFWFDFNLTKENIYYYTVKSYRDNTFSDLSNILSFTMNNIDSDFVLVEAGQFKMGDHYNEGHYDELPIHDVYLSEFYINKFEVTNVQAIWIFNWGIEEALLQIEGSKLIYYEEEYIEIIDLLSSGIIISDNDLLLVNDQNYKKPCTSISWYGSVLLCNILSMIRSKEVCYNLSDWSCEFTANGYRLPTEAEWEYAARGGPSLVYDFRYSGCGVERELINYAWFFQNSNGQKHTIGKKLPNQLLINDMSGNVWEWCWDWYVSIYYQQSPYENPKGPSNGYNKLIRGGSWLMPAYGCRVAQRCVCYPEICNVYVGLRLVTNEM